MHECYVEVLKEGLVLVMDIDLAARHTRSAFIRYRTEHQSHRRCKASVKTLWL